MNFLDQQSIVAITILLAAIALAGCWHVRGIRLRIASWEARPVPWGGFHVALIMMAYMMTLVAANELVPDAGTPNATAASGDGSSSGAGGAGGGNAEGAAGEGEPAQSEHPVHTILSADAGWPVWLFCGLSVIVVAPIAEEFFFRVVLQGWLSAVESRWFVGSSVPIPGCTLTVTGLALLFALLHAREGESDPAALATRLMILGVIANTAGVAVGIGVLRASGATWADMGWNRREAGADARRGILLGIGVVAVLLAVQAGTFVLTQAEVAADPVPLFVLAMIQGLLYWKRGRIVVNVVVHGLLNLVSFGLVLLKAGGYL